MTKLKVLQALHQSEEFCSGEQLCKALGVSRNAIWKAVTQLRKEGYVIEAVTNRGYRLGKEQDLMEEPAIRAALHTSIVGKRILFLPVTPSTNIEARKFAFDRAYGGAVFLTEQQTEGRSKRGGRFYSAERGLYLSLLLQPDCGPAGLPTFCAAMLRATADAVKAVTGVMPEVRFPNELFVNGKKLCGMLTEVHLEAESEALAYLIAGIGIYCNNQEFPAGIDAVSLRQLTGREIDRNQLAAELLNRLDEIAVRFG